MIEKNKISKTPLSPINRQVGENIKSLRHKNSLSQRDLATLLGVSFQQIQKYESGQNRIPLEHLIFLKTYFNTHYDALLPEKKVTRDTARLSTHSTHTRSMDIDKITERIFHSVRHTKDINTLKKIHKIIHILQS